MRGREKIAGLTKCSEPKRERGGGVGKNDRPKIARGKKETMVASLLIPRQRKKRKLKDNNWRGKSMEDERVLGDNASTLDQRSRGKVKVDQAKEESGLVNQIPCCGKKRQSNVYPGRRITSLVDGITTLHESGDRSRQRSR